MVSRNSVLLWAGLAVLGVACAGPRRPVPVAEERGRRIDPAILRGLQRGVTTREEALRLLGEPTTATADPAAGTRTLAWEYRHVDARTSLAITTVLKFGPDDRLLIKFVNQDVHSH